MEKSIPPLNGLLGTKLPVRDLAGTCSWYSRVFGWEAVMEFPGPDGTIAGAAGRLPGANPTGLSFRANPAAQSQEGLELAIDISHREDLEAWLEHLDREGVPHSPVIDASVAWLVVLKAETPAG